MLLYKNKRFHENKKKLHGMRFIVVMGVFQKYHKAQL